MTTIDQDRYMRWFAQGVSGADVNHHDLVHNQVFDFGMPYDSTLNILAVSGSDFIVSYTTALVDPDEEI